MGGSAEVDPILSLNPDQATVTAVSGPTEFLDPVTKEKIILAIPAAGINWGEGHGHGDNATDVAGSCGSNIYAAAAGVVTEAKEGWNHGYGNYVAIDHSGGISTLYAHNKDNLVAVGQIVAAGDLIAKMGRTGDATGCHVHFETSGVTNPFVWK